MERKIGSVVYILEDVHITHVLLVVVDSFQDDLEKVCDICATVLIE